MSKQWKANEYLLDQGKIKEIKRGRRSAENIAFLVDAVANGVKFSDFTPAETTTPQGETVVKNVAKPAGSSNIDNFNEGFVRYPEDENWIVREKGANGKIRSLREACQNCRYSLAGHLCQNPVIVKRDGSGSIGVTIERG